MLGHHYSCDFVIFGNRMPQRVMVLGGSGAGKSSLIQSLKNGHVQLAKYPTDGVAVTPWAPHESYQAGKCYRNNERLITPCK